MSYPMFTHEVGHHVQLGQLDEYQFGYGDFDGVDGHHIRETQLSYCHTSPKSSGRSDNPNDTFLYPTTFTREVSRNVNETPYTFDDPLYYDKGQAHGSMVTRYISPRIAQHLFTAPPQFDGLMGNAIDASNVKALNKLRDNKAEILVDLAQARQTMDMIADAVIPPVKALLALKRGQWGRIPGIFGLSGHNPRRLRDFPGKPIGSKWLEYQYGWKPAMSTVKGLIDFFREQPRDNMLISAQATVPVDEVMSSKVDNTLFVIRRGSGTATTRYWAKVVDPSFDNMDRLGLSNPATLAWEVIPFSFVVDWFVPIGDVLAAMSATVGLEFKAGFIRTRKLTSSDYTATALPGVTEPGFLREEGFQFTRKALGGFNRPQLYADTSPFSSARVKNAAALISQLRR